MQGGDPVGGTTRCLRVGLATQVLAGCHCRSGGMVIRDRLFVAVVWPLFWRSSVPLSGGEEC